MKVKITLIILLITSIGYAQNGINYKAVIKDDSGSIVANDLIEVQFSILKGASLNSIYTESHTTTTDSNGIVILNIGEGTATAGTFTSINWAGDDHFLNVQVNIGSGLIDMGTTEFKSVPYALVAEDVKNLLWDENGNDDIYRTSGRVGIGISEPEKMLHVGGDVFIQTNLGELIMGFPENGNQWQMSTRDSGADLQFQSKATSINSFTTQFRMRQNGEFQVGDISTPSAWLHVKNNSNINKEQLLLEEVGNDYARLGFTNTTSDAKWDIAGLPSNTASSAHLNFYFRNDAGAGDKMTITGDGEVGINGNPSARLEIFQKSQTVGTGLRFDDGTANSDWDITHGFALRFHYGGNLKSLINANTGAYTVSSDVSLKNNIENMKSTLDRVKQLRPTTYYYKDDSSKTKALGFIAQEVKPIFPEVVHFSEADQLYGIDYAAFSVIAIKAIQEQQEIIKSLQSTVGSQEIAINTQNSKINTLTAELNQLKTLDTRVEKLEAMLKTLDE